MLKVIIVSILILIALLSFFYWYSSKEQKEVEENKRLIIYNRRTRQIKEVANINYEENKTWEKIVTTYDSMIDRFLHYLKREDMIDNIENPRYIGDVSSHGALILRAEFKEFLHEIEY